jgi:hypothetical protein
VRYFLAKPFSIVGKDGTPNGRHMWIELNERDAFHSALKKSSESN